MASHVMDFAANVEIDRPVEDAFGEIADLETAFARLAKKYPVSIKRRVGRGPAAIGDKWRITGDTRLGERSGVTRLVGLAPPSRIAFQSKARGFELETTWRFEAIGADRCRLSAANRLSAISLKARLIAPAVRLARSRIENGHEKALRRIARTLSQDAAP